MGGCLQYFSFVSISIYSVIHDTGKQGSSEMGALQEFFWHFLQCFYAIPIAFDGTLLVDFSESPLDCIIGG